MGRRLVLAVLTLSALATASLAETGADAAIPRGPHLAVIAGSELFLTGPDGQAPHAIEGEDESGEAFIGYRPIWTPDGREIASFSYRIDNPAISLIAADGSRFRLLESDVGVYWEPAPDPATDGLVVSGGRDEPTVPGGQQSSVRSGLWSMSTDGSASRFIGDAGNSFFPYSFAPDGTAAASVAKWMGGGPAGIATFDPEQGRLRTIVPQQGNGNYDPAVSPDGTEIAYLHYIYAPEGVVRWSVQSTDLMLVPIAGGKPRRLFRIAGYAHDPSWDPSGSRIVFSKTASVVEINADGTCRKKVFSSPAGSRIGGAAWQPGPGRGVPPLSC